MKKKLKILIVEDSKVFAQGLELLLNQHSLIEQIHLEKDFEGTLDVLKTTPIDLVILDLNLETKAYDGTVISKKIKQLYPAIKILILTENVRIHIYEKLFNECMVDAYLDKQSGIEETFKAINEVLEGRKYVDQSIKEMLEIEGWMKASKREKEIIAELIKGLTQKEIAEKLYISSKTVEVHIRNLFKKFQVKNSTELAAKYVKYINANRENLEETIPPFKSVN